MKYSVDNNGVVLSMVGAQDSGFGIVSGPKPPPCFDCGGYAIVDGLFQVVNADLVLGANKERLLSDLDTVADGHLSAGIEVGGVKVSTSQAALSRLALGKQHPKASRKIVINGGKNHALVTQAEFDAIVDAVAEYGQEIMDNWHDLIEAINAATTVAQLEAIDITTGWPA